MTCTPISPPCSPDIHKPRSQMRHRSLSSRLSYNGDARTQRLPSFSSKSKKLAATTTVYDAWLSSRQVPGHHGTRLIPGALRPLNLENAKVAFAVTQLCLFDFLKALWSLNPLRTTLMMTLNITRSLFPAFRGYSQALIVDELQLLIASGSFTWSRLLWLLSSEIMRRVVEGLLDSLASSNEKIVQGSARFFIEYKQMEHRVKLDVPTLKDPLVRDLLQESDLFARSFNGGGFGTLSPLDFAHILSLLTEIASHVYLVISLTRGALHLGILILSVFSVMLPMMVSWFIRSPTSFESASSAREARASDRLERMRNLAYSDTYRSEIALFGLGDWVLKSWSNAKKVLLVAEQPAYDRDHSIFSKFNLTELVSALQNIPLLLLLQNSATSLGSLTVYRTSIQCMLYASLNLVTTVKMAFQSIFLMSAFCASIKLKPRLNPKTEDRVKYTSMSGGASIQLSGLSYTYPGSPEPALRNISLNIDSGETLAIVGYNGSGKSTLAKVLLRITDFEGGSFFLNGVDIRKVNPDEYHRHVSAVFQGFSKFNTTVKENVGIGNIEQVGYRPAIEAAIHLAEADNLVESLPHGLKTQLESPGFETISYPGSVNLSPQRHGLSGGEWQRIAIARAFMRARDPEIDLLVFDEPTSSLDAHAQNQIFSTIEKLSRSSSGERTKTVIFITHRLSTARRADKIAMMENGKITEFGTHQELLEQDKAYAALYRASV